MEVWGVSTKSNEIMVLENMSKEFYTLPVFIDHIIGLYAEEMGMDHNDVINMLLHLAAHYDEVQSLSEWYNENK